MGILSKLFRRRVDISGVYEKDRRTDCQGCGSSYEWSSAYWTLGMPDCPKCGYNNKKMMNATQNLEPATRPPELIHSGTKDAFNDINANNIKVSCRRCGAMILPSTGERTGGLCIPCVNGTREQINSAKMKDPSGPLTRNEIDSLPYWGQVAFAARCARRAQPAINAIANRLGRDQINFLDNAIFIAENASLIAERPDSDLRFIDEKINKILEETGGNKLVSGPVSGPLNPIDFANAAIMTIENTIRLLFGPNKYLASVALNLSIAASSYNYSGDKSEAIKSLRSDYKSLLQYCITRGFDDNSPVPSEVFELLKSEEEAPIVCGKCGITLAARLKYWNSQTTQGVERVGSERDLFLYCNHCRMEICGGCSIDLGMAAGCPFCETELVCLNGKNVDNPTAAQTQKDENDILMSTPENLSYENYQGMKKLGDRALSAKQYEKAIESYEKALKYFNIPNHPKYLAVLEGINKAKKELMIKSGNFHAKGYVQDGIIKPLIIHIRLYSNKQLPDDEWNNIVLEAFAASLDIHSQLKGIIDLAGKNCEVHSTWEYSPYVDEAFKNVVANRGQTFFETLIASPNPKLCRLFTSDIAFSVCEQQAQGIIFAVVFGEETA